MTQQTNRKEPQVRFKGFMGRWNSEQLGNVLQLDNGFAFKSRFFLSKETAVIVVTPGSVHIGGGFQRGKGQFYDPHEVVPDKYKFQAGDVFVTMTDLTPTAQALGFPARIPDDGITYLHNQRLGKLTGFDGDQEFLFQLLCTDKYHRFIVSTSSGTTVKHSSPQKILSFEALMPEPDEQTQIGKYFKSLDRMIGLHQRKHDKLVTLKQAMLQKMFPQDGVTTPEIRFKGFDKPWEPKTLGDVVRISSASRVHKHEWTKSGVPFFRSSDVVAKYKGETNSKAFISKELYDLLSARSGKLEKGDILITGGGSIGIPYQVESDAPLYSKDADLLWLKIGPEIESNFLYTFFLSHKFRTYIKSISHIGTIAHYTVIQATRTPIAMPCFDEQQKIGAYFHKLTDLIRQHSTQLEKLKNIKSACLEKMFV